MRKSQRLLLAEIEHLAGIMGQVARQPSHAAQRQCLLSSVVEWFGAKAGVLFSIRLDNPEQVEIRVAASDGWLTDRERVLFREDATRHYYQTSPFLRRIALLSVRQPDIPLAASRHELVNDVEWYRSNYCQQVYQPLDIDHSLIALSPAHAGEWTGLALVRAWGEKRDFTAAQRTAAQLLQKSLAYLCTGDPSSSDSDLPPRLKQVVELLMRGLSEREIARAVRLSPYTIHRHVGRLYRKLAVNSRAEFMARMSQRTPVNKE